MVRGVWKAKMVRGRFLNDCSFLGAQLSGPVQYFQFMKSLNCCYENSTFNTTKFYRFSQLMKKLCGD